MLELEDGDIHQVIMSKEQEKSLKAFLNALGTVQLSSAPLDIKFGDI